MRITTLQQLIQLVLPDTGQRRKLLYSLPKLSKSERTQLEKDLLILLKRNSNAIL